MGRAHMRRHLCLRVPACARVCVPACVCLCRVSCVRARVFTSVTSVCTARTPGKAAKGGDSRSISDKPPLCGPLCFQRKMQKVFLHQEEAGDPLSTGPHGGASLSQMESPRPTHLARPSTRSALSPCVPPRPPSGSSKTPASLSSGPLQQLPPCPGTCLFSTGEPCLSPRPWVCWALHRGAFPDHLG